MCANELCRDFILRAIYFADVLSLFFCGLPRSHKFSETTRHIFPKLSVLVELCKGLINFAFIWRSLKGRCHGNQLKSQNRRFWRTNLYCRTAIPKRIGISERRWAV